MSTRVIAYSDALAVARRWFLRSRPLDMRALAEELAVGRATLYRVVGSRDRLLGDVVFGLSEITVVRAEAAVAADTPPGVERIIQTAMRTNEAIVAFQPLRNFMEDDPEGAFRVLFMPTARVHERSVEQWRRIIVDAVERGEVHLCGRDPDRVAYMFIRIGESMIFADLLAGREPDLHMAAELQRTLMGDPPPDR